MGTVHTQLRVHAERIPKRGLIRLTFCDFVTLKPHSRKKSVENEGGPTEVIARVVTALEHYMSDVILRLHERPSFGLKLGAHWEVACKNQRDLNKAAGHLAAWLSMQHGSSLRPTHPIIADVRYDFSFFPDE